MKNIIKISSKTKQNMFKIYNKIIKNFNTFPEKIKKILRNIIKKFIIRQFTIFSISIITSIGIMFLHEFFPFCYLLIKDVTKIFYSINFSFLIPLISIFEALTQIFEIPIAYCSDNEEKNDPDKEEKNDSSEEKKTDRPGPFPNLPRIVQLRRIEDLIPNRAMYFRPIQYPLEIAFRDMGLPGLSYLPSYLPPYLSSVFPFTPPSDIATRTLLDPGISPTISRIAQRNSDSDIDIDIDSDMDSDMDSMFDSDEEKSESLPKLGKRKRSN